MRVPTSPAVEEQTSILEGDILDLQPHLTGNDDDDNCGVGGDDSRRTSDVGAWLARQPATPELRPPTSRAAPRRRPPLLVVSASARMRPMSVVAAMGLGPRTRSEQRAKA